MSTMSAATRTRRNINAGFIVEAAVLFVVAAMVLGTLLLSLSSAKDAQRRTQAMADAQQRAMEQAVAGTLGTPPHTTTPEIAERMRPETGPHLPDIPWTPVLYTLGGGSILIAAGAGGTALRRRHTTRAEHAALARDRWNAATDLHDTITTEYADIRLDTTAALTHAALWDITDPHTQAFTLAYGKATDARSLHPRPPTDPAEVDAYRAHVDDAHQAWVAARDNAANRSAPKALRRTRANKTGLLSVATSILKPRRQRSTVTT